MTRRLRAGKGKNGLVLANGGVLTYQHVLILSSVPRADGLSYPDKTPLPEILAGDIPLVDETAEGEATIEVRFSHTFLEKLANQNLRSDLYCRF